MPSALGCALAEDVVAPIDVPPFDRSNVDGFAVRSADLASAGEASPVRADAERRGDRLRHRAGAAGIVGHGHIDRDRRSGAARRGRHRHGRAYPAGGRLARSKSAAPRRPDNSCPMPAPISPAARRCCVPAPSSARARSACWRPAASRMSRSRGRPRVAIISTGDELVQPGQPLRPAAIYDTNGAIVTAAISRERRRGSFFRRHPG